MGSENRGRSAANRTLLDVSGVNEETADALRYAGYHTVDDLRAASEDDLAAVEGISAPLAAHIKTAVGEADQCEDIETNDGETREAWPRGDLREPTPTASTDTGQPPYFEETLTPQLPGGVLGLVVACWLLISAPILGLILLMAPPWALDLELLALPVLTSLPMGIFVGMIVYSNWRVFVTVTDDGVEIVRNWNAWGGAPRVTVPFEDVSHVAYSATGGPPMQVPRSSTGERPRHTYMMRPGRLPGLDPSYSGGVRIDRHVGAPIFVGSARPAELAGTIDRRVTVRRTPAASQPSAEQADGEEEAADEASETESAETVGGSGSIPGATERQERWGVVAVILFAVGMIVAIEGFGSIGVTAVLGVLGALFFVGGLDALRVQRRELRSFEETTGTVLTTVASETTENRRRPLIQYEYVVDGEPYTNDKIWPGKPSAVRMSPRGSHDFLSSFPEGEPTKVYYDPADPSNAFLVRDGHTGWLLLSIVVGACLLGYLSLVVRGVAAPPSV